MQCGPLPSNVTRELAASGQSVDSLGLVPGSSFVTLIEFQTQMENTIKEHNSSLAWALYQALHLSDPANVPANHALGQALILDFTSTHMEGGTGFYIRYASVAFGPLATYRAETPGEWVNYDAFLKGLQGPGHESRMLGVVVVRAPGFETRSFAYH